MARKLLPTVRLRHPVHLRRQCEPPVPDVHGAADMNNTPRCEHVVIVPGTPALVHLEFALSSPFYCDGCQHPKVIAEQLLAMVWGFA